MDHCVWSSKRMLVGNSSKGVKVPSFHNGYPIKCRPLYLHRVAWMGRDHAELLSNTIPSHQCFQFHHRFNSIQPMYFLYVPLEGRGEEIEEPSRMGYLPVHWMSQSLFNTLLWFQKTCFFIILSFLDGLNSAAGSFFILFYGELIV